MRDLTSDSDNVAFFDKVLQDYAAWFGEVSKGHVSVEPPEDFLAWCDAVKHEAFLNQKLIAKARDAFLALHTKAIDQGGGFSEDYGACMALVHHISLHVLQTNFGYDTETGLRNEKAMYDDLSSELERRAREGSPFCLVLGRIDHWDKIKDEVDETLYKEIMTQLSAVMRACVRRFDDAYRLQNGDFVMSLKQTKTTGGAAAVKRFKSMLANKKVVVPHGDDGDDVLTMSFCLAEPVPGDTLEDLIRNMRTDMLRIVGEDESAALEYIERSPLERYLSDNTEK